MTKEERERRFGMTPEKALEVYPENISSKLKILRVKKGMSQNDLSVASNVKKRLIQSYESGERSIDNARLETLCDLAETLGCKISDILESETLKEKFENVK